jgi:glutathione peroxidase
MDPQNTQTMKKWLLLAVLPLVIIAIVLIQNRDAVNMTFRQKMLRTIYPLLARVTKKAGPNGVIARPESPVAPKTSVFEKPMTLIDGDTCTLDRFRGKKILLVNTASDCGYTGQYASLQALHEKYSDRLIIIGFPANDFKEQEKAGNDQIAAFCQRNYGVTFPLSVKVIVIKGGAQDPVFKWLSDPEQNGWNNRAPVWNFSKYLIDEQGRLAGYFGPAIDPMDEVFIEALGIK